MPITTRYSQTFYEEEANALVASGTIQPCTIEQGLVHKRDHNSTECDYCSIYYGGTEALVR